MTPFANNGVMNKAIKETKQENGFGKLLIFFAILIVAATLGLWFRDSLSLESLAQRETELRDFQQQQPWLTFGLAFLLYVAVAGLSIPGATVLSLTYAWFFGFWPSLILVSFASTLGATIAFLTSRYLLFEFVQQKFARQFETINANFLTEGPFYLFALRLIPAFPFVVVNLLMGMTPIRASTYWWVSQLGMLPGTVIYLWAGSSVPSLKELAEQGVGGILSWQLFVAFSLLGLFPFLARWVLRKIRPKQPSSP